MTAANQSKHDPTESDHGSDSSPLVELEEGDSSVPVTPIRRRIAEHLAQSTTTIPHAWTVRAIDATRIVEYRDETNLAFSNQHGFPLSYQVPIIQALCSALGQHRLLNSRWTGAQIILKGRVHLGIAVAVPEGVVVPVIQNADRLKFVELAGAFHEVVRRARERRLRPADMHAATFTLNNPGAYGALLSYAIIPSGQCAILTTQAITPTPVVRDDKVVIRKMMNVCLSFDHRIMDGAIAAAFLEDLRERLEDWTSPPLP